MAVVTCKNEVYLLEQSWKRDRTRKNLCAAQLKFCHCFCVITAIFLCHIMNKYLSRGKSSTPVSLEYQEQPKQGKLFFNCGIVLFLHIRLAKYTVSLCSPCFLLVTPLIFLCYFIHTDLFKLNLWCSPHLIVTEMKDKTVRAVLVFDFQDFR